MEIIGIIVLMTLWLSLVALTIVLLFKKIKTLKDNEKKSYNFLF